MSSATTLDPVELFYDLVSIEPVYEPEPIFFEPAWTFAYRFQSLHRHWELSREYLRGVMDSLKGLDGEGIECFWENYEEVVAVDEEYFPEYLRMSIIAMALAVTENLLVSTCEEIAEELGSKVKLERSRTSLLEKYVRWLQATGLPLSVEPDTWAHLRAIRGVRNQFVHKLGGELSKSAISAIRKQTGENLKNTQQVGDCFVDASLAELARFAKLVEVARIEFHESRSRVAVQCNHSTVDGSR